THPWPFPVRTSCASPLARTRSKYRQRAEPHLVPAAAILKFLSRLPRALLEGPGQALLERRQPNLVVVGRRSAIKKLCDLRAGKGIVRLRGRHRKTSSAGVKAH